MTISRRSLCMGVHCGYAGAMGAPFVARAQQAEFVQEMRTIYRTARIHEYRAREMASRRADHADRDRDRRAADSEPTGNLLWPSL